MKLLRRIAVGSLLVVAALTSASAATSSGASAATHPRPVTDFVTFYGWVDNSPPSPNIAHPCIHPTAGGVGTFSNPVTFAEPNDLRGPWCQVIYVPFLKKYFIHEDQCKPCGGVNTRHVDLWMGGDRRSTRQPEKRSLLTCENRWTVRHATVVLDPPATEPVDPTALFTPPRTCHGGQGD